MKQCRRCLLSETNAEELLKSVRELIDGLGHDERADEATYQARLKLCMSCDSLVSGTCQKCGCFVELRAAKRTQYCPSEDKRW